jgi:hypothetical protein
MTMLPEHDQKIRSRKQIIDIGKYSIVNRTIKLWNQLTSEALATSPVDHIILKGRLGKVIISEVKWREVNWCEVKGYEAWR